MERQRAIVAQKHDGLDALCVDSRQGKVTHVPAGQNRENGLSLQVKKASMTADPSTGRFDQLQMSFGAITSLSYSSWGRSSGAPLSAALPWTGGVDCLSVKKQPSADVQQTLFHDDGNTSIGCRPDSEEQISTAADDVSEHEHQLATVR